MKYLICAYLNKKACLDDFDSHFWNARVNMYLSFQVSEAYDVI
jgi:hypothetical protein